MDKLTEQIIKLFANNPFDTLNPKQVAARVGAHDKSGRSLVQATIYELAEAGVLLEEGRGK